MAAVDRVIHKLSTNYVGETKNSVRNGHGIYKYSNKFFTYEGEWVNGVKHGKGILNMADGSYYQGEFVNGEIIGEGFRSWSSNGNTYSGHFHLGEMHGTGSLRYGNGDVFEGDFVHNQREGKGRMQYANSDVYEGEYYQNKRHGEGKFTRADGEVYEGYWYNGFRHGHGVQTFWDSSIYEGQWRADRFSGQGCFNHVSGVIYEGIWINGMPSVWAEKIVILGEDTIEIEQKSPLTLQIECQTDENQTVDWDTGRKLQIIAGIPKPKIPDDFDYPQSDCFESPFGDMVIYPLLRTAEFHISNAPSNEALSLNEEDVTHTCMPHPEKETADVIAGPQTENSDVKANVQQRADEGDNKANEVDQQLLNASETEDAHTEKENTHETLSDAQDLDHGIQPLSTLLPVITTSTVSGRAEFVDLRLGPVPEHYWPHNIPAEGSSKKDKKGKSRGSRASSVASHTSNKTTDSRRSRSSQKIPEKEVFPLPGEYVLMVHEITTPPFLGRIMQPAFVKVNMVKEAQGTSPSRSSSRRRKTDRKPAAHTSPKPQADQSVNPPKKEVSSSPLKRHSRQTKRKN